MNIRKVINQNGKLILQIALIIIAILIGIRLLNIYYEQDAVIKKEEIGSKVEKPKITQNDYTTESNSVEIAMASFVSYCNNKDLENAYKMLTDECKNAMFPTIEDFEKIYIDNIYNVKRDYDLKRWTTSGNKITYLVTLYEDLLATGGIEKLTQDYYTFIQDENGSYKLNINNYIFGQSLNIEKNINNIKVNIEHIDIYNEYQEFTLKITNNTSRTICLTGASNSNNLYIENADNRKYPSINSGFDGGEEILLESKKSRIFNVKFDKIYNPNNLGGRLVIEDIILDYGSYIDSIDRARYTNKAKITIEL